MSRRFGTIELQNPRISRRSGIIELLEGRVGGAGATATAASKQLSRSGKSHGPSPPGNKYPFWDSLTSTSHLDFCHGPCLCVLSWLCERAVRIYHPDTLGHILWSSQCTPACFGWFTYACPYMYTHEPPSRCIHT